MNINEFKDFLKKVKEKCGTTIYLQGPPGCGKSSAIKQIVEEEGYDYFADLRLGTMDIMELRGVQIPLASEARTVETLPSYFPTNPEARGILLLDEFDHAPPAVQSAAYQLVLDRKIGPFKLPEGVTVVMCSNRREDKGVHFKVPRPTKNRVITIAVKTTLEEWLEYAKANDLDERIISFITSNSHMLYHDSDDSHGEDKGFGAFATPRSWTVASDILSLELPPYILEEALMGTVGYDASKALLNHIINIDNSLDVTKIIEGKFEDFKEEDLGNNIALTHTLIMLEKHLKGAKSANINVLRFIKDCIPDIMYKITYWKTLTSVNPNLFKFRKKDENELRLALIKEISNSNLM